MATALRKVEAAEATKRCKNKSLKKKRDQFCFQSSFLTNSKEKRKTIATLRSATRARCQPSPSSIPQLHRISSYPRACHCHPGLGPERCASL